MRNLIQILLISFIVFTSCEQEKKVSNPADYQAYLQNTNKENLATINEEIAFWEDKDATTLSTVYKTKLANLYSGKYKFDGDVTNLSKAQLLLEEVDSSLGEKSAGVYRMLAANSISQHEFRRAYDYASIASEIKDKQYSSKLILFDACMELGYYIQAEGILNELKDKNTFEYQIRLAKWMDYKGDLDQAVFIMEDAQTKISPNNNDLKLWTLSNLGDMYGHQGKVSKAYDSYLAALAIDPEYYYALKGIAYIVYAHDNDTDEAKQILSYLDKTHPIPDYKLMLADIAAFENNEQDEKLYREAFYNEVSKIAYGNMYNAYILDLDLAAQRFDKAVSLAEQEVQHRGTPETYDFLAWTYYQAGQKERALEIAKMHVEGKTFEPGASYHLGVLYLEVDAEKAQTHLKEALEASFELGPNTSKEIQNTLSSI